MDMHAKLATITFCSYIYLYVRQGLYLAKFAKYLMHHCGLLDCVQLHHAMTGARSEECLLLAVSATCTKI